MISTITETKASHADIVRRLIDDVFNRGKTQVADKLLHPEYSYASPRETMPGIAAFKAYATAFREAFPDLHIEVVDTITQSDSVCTRILMTGTHQGDFFGLPATGSSIEVSGVVMSYFAEGRIIREWELLDDLAMQQQLGLLD